jgi:hypothetical protein
MVTNVYGDSITNGTEIANVDTVNPRYLVICEHSPDNLHHFERQGEYRILKIKDSSGNVIETIASIPCVCKHCGLQIRIDAYEEKYGLATDIHTSLIFKDWIYESDWKDIDDSSMIFWI